MDYSYGSWSVWLEGKATGHTMVTQPHVVPVIASDSLCRSYRCMKSVSNMSKKKYFLCFRAEILKDLHLVMQLHF